MATDAPARDLLTQTLAFGRMLRAAGVACTTSEVMDAARALDRELAPSIDLLRVTVNPIAIKCALNLLGHDVGGHRLPLVEATDDERDAVRGCLERLGLLTPVAA